MQLNVTIERVLYPKPEVADADWYMLKSNQGICKGKMAWRPDPYETLILDGEWCTYRGERQFRFDSAILDVPTDPRAQLHYVCERTPGIGPSLEAAIWEFAGDGWKSVDAGQIKKLNGKLLAELRIQIEALERDGEQAKAVAWLMSKGATQAMACAAWDRWEKDTTGIVTSNCYQLAELPNYGFRHVDAEIRKAFGIGDSDHRRIRAAITYGLRQLTGSGSTVIEWPSLQKQCMGLLGGYMELITECTRELFGDGTLIGFKRSISVALGADYRDECDIWAFVNQPEPAKAEEKTEAETETGKG